MRFMIIIIKKLQSYKLSQESILFL